MKKTIIAMFALAGVAMGAGTTNYTLSAGNPTAPGIAGSSDLLVLYSALKDQTKNAVYVGANNSTTLPTNAGSYELSANSFSADTQTLRLYERSAKSGDWYGSYTGLDLNSDVASLTTTVTFNLAYDSASQGTYNVESGIIQVANGVATLISSATSDSVTLSGSTTTGTITSTLEVEEFAYVDGAKYYSIFRVVGTNPAQGAATGYNTATLTTWSSSTTVAPVVPEPATATLSLLALAGLASRRRRH